LVLYSGGQINNHCRLLRTWGKGDALKEGAPHVIARFGDACSDWLLGVMSIDNLNLSLDPHDLNASSTLPISTQNPHIEHRIRMRTSTQSVSQYEAENTPGVFAVFGVGDSTSRFRICAKEK
jgi:hypothetical protein